MMVTCSFSSALCVLRKSQVTRKCKGILGAPADALGNLQMCCKPQMGCGRVRVTQPQVKTTLPEGSVQNACSRFPSQTGFVGRASDSLGVGVLLKLSYGGSVRSSPSFRWRFFHSQLFMATVMRWISPLLLSVQKVKDKWHLLSEANARMLLNFSPPDCKQ